MTYVVALLLLAPWAAESSWGGFTALDSLVVVLVLAPMYGGAAVLIRETARRFGLGWPGIVLLAAAFGWVQAGLVDQSLFNPDFLADTSFAESASAARATLVPGLGFSGSQALAYVGNHVTLSICAPIAIVECLAPRERRAVPWLRWRGFAVVVALYVAGSWLVFADPDGRKDFLASPVQVLFAAGVAAALIAAAVLRPAVPGLSPSSPSPSSPPPSSPPLPPSSAAAAAPTSGPSPVAAPRPWLVAAVTVLAALTADLLPGWAGVAVHLGVLLAAAALVARWSRRTGWSQRHVLAAWGGFLGTAAALAWLVPPYTPAGPVESAIGDAVVGVVTVALLTAAALRARPSVTSPSH